MVMIFAEHASGYIALGWPVFPLAEGTKVPAVKGGSGFKMATTNSEVIKVWEQEYPNANIGLRCGAEGNFMVIDVDPRNGGDETIKRLAENGQVLPDAPTALTCQGGTHLFFAHDGRIRSSQNRLGRGIDIKSEGGYVVTPPSRWAENGGVYRWIRPPRGNALPKLPRWVIERLTPKPAPRRVAPTEGCANVRIQGLLDRIATAPIGRRNGMLNCCSFYAFQMIEDVDMSPDALAGALITAGVSAGLCRQECENTVRSAQEAARRSAPNSGH